MRIGILKPMVIGLVLAFLSVPLQAALTVAVPDVTISSSAAGSSFLDVFFSDVTGNTENLAAFNVRIDLTGGPGVTFDITGAKTPASYVFDGDSGATPINSVNASSISFQANAILSAGDTSIALNAGLVRVPFDYTGVPGLWTLTVVTESEQSLLSNGEAIEIPASWVNGSISVVPEPTVALGLLAVVLPVLSRRPRRR